MAIEDLINESVAVEGNERQPGESCVMKYAPPHEPIRPRVFQQVGHNMPAGRRLVCTGLRLQIRSRSCKPRAWPGFVAHEAEKTGSMIMRSGWAAGTSRNCGVATENDRHRDRAVLCCSFRPFKVA